MKRNVKILTVSDFFYGESLRDDYICYSINKNYLDESWTSYYEKIIETIFENGPLEFIHMTVVKGYKQNELISYEVNINKEYLLAIHHYLTNKISYNGLKFNELKEKAKTDEDLQDRIRKFWSYQLYFQVFYKE